MLYLDASDFFWHVCGSHLTDGCLHEGPGSHTGTACWDDQRAATLVFAARYGRDELCPGKEAASNRLEKLYILRLKLLHIALSALPKDRR